MRAGIPRLGHAVSFLVPAVSRVKDVFSLADESDNKQTTPKSVDKRVNGRPDDPQMGAALRSVYQKTVEEAVPDDLLDLLSKLD